MVDALLQPDGIEYLDDTLEVCSLHRGLFKFAFLFGAKMITAMTYYPPEISPFMWSCLPRSASGLPAVTKLLYLCGHTRVLCRISGMFLDWAGDYLSSMLPPIDNYI